MPEQAANRFGIPGALIRTLGIYISQRLSRQLVQACRLSIVMDQTLYRTGRKRLAIPIDKQVVYPGTACRTDR